jgi:hypothetical protein
VHEVGGLLGQVIDEGQPYQKDVRVNSQYNAPAGSPRNSLKGFNAWGQAQIKTDSGSVIYDYWYHTHPFEIGNVHPDTGARQVQDPRVVSGPDAGISRDLGGLTGGDHNSHQHCRI